MGTSERGPERRSVHVPGERGPRDRERRTGVDRRRSGHLAALDLCRGMPFGTLERVFERCPMTRLAPGDVLLDLAQENHYLYFLLEGRLEVHLKSIDSPVADVIEAGECVGEMSIIDGRPTSAIVTASAASTVVAVHENVFWSEFAVSPVAMRNLARVLAERMRKRNDVTLRALEHELRLSQLEKELAAAYEIQVGMLPAGPPLLGDFPAIDVYGRTAVAKVVGGDLYDAFALDRDRVCIAIGDVSGKGMPAALFMVQAVTLLRVEMTKSADLLTAVTRINRALCDTSIAHMFVSLIIITIDTKTGALRYINAGHPPFLAARRGGAYLPVGTSGGLIAGVLEDCAYETGELTLAAGDRLLLYTDGITEARDRSRRFYGGERLARFLDACAAVDAAACVDALVEDVLRFTGGTPQNDDITALALTFIGVGPDQVPA